MGIQMPETAGPSGTFAALDRHQPDGPTTFHYLGTAVRIVMIDGEPWWVAKDVCDVLGVQNTADTLRKILDDDEKGVATVYTPGGDQQMAIVSEPGLYSLILRSRKPEAKAFKRWITHEVIPSIRRTGRYVAPAALPTKRELAQWVIEAENRADEAERLRVIAQKGREAAECYAKELEPKAQYVDDFVSTDDCILFRTLANQLNMRESELRDLLVKKKRIYRKFIGQRFSTKVGRLVDEYEWRAYAEHKQHFRLFPQHNAPRHHNNQLRQTLYITPPGAQAIKNLVGAVTPA